MSAGDRDTLAALLDQHRYCESATGPWRWCSCGLGRDANGGFGPALHRAHVADVLLASDWLREQRATAWDEGAEVVYEHWSDAEGPWWDTPQDHYPNPYRRTREDIDAH